MGGTVPKAPLSDQEPLRELVTVRRSDDMPTAVVGITSRPLRYTSASRPRTQRQRFLVVLVHDLLRQCLEECVAHTRLAKLLQSVFGQQDAWGELLCDVGRLAEMSSNQLHGVEPTLDPLTLYEATLYLRTRWMNLRRVHFSQGNEDSQISVETGSQTGLMEEVNLFEQLIGHLKELISLTPP